MANPKDITFSINDYDSDGDLITEGVFLHFGETRVKASDSIEEFYSIFDHMKAIVREIDNITIIENDRKREISK